MPLLSSTTGLSSPDDFKTAVEWGFYEGYRHFRKFGENRDIDSGTEDIWVAGGVRTMPTSAAVAVVSSSSTADDGDPAGTGARTVIIYGLDENWQEVFEVVTMNGQSTVSTTQTFLRTNRARVVTAGSGASNAGTITCTVGGNTQWTIAPLQGGTQVSHMSVPADHDLIITDVNVTTGRMGAQDVQVQLQRRTPGDNNDGAWQTLVEFDLYETVFEDAHLRPNLPEKTDFRWQAVTTGSNLVVSAQTTGFLVRSSMLTGAIYERPYNV